MPLKEYVKYDPENPDSGLMFTHPNKRVISVGDFAQSVGIKRRELMTAMQKGEIPFSFVSGRRRFAGNLVGFKASEFPKISRLDLLKPKVILSAGKPVMNGRNRTWVWDGIRWT
jgi:hypothetical protein